MDLPYRLIAVDVDGTLMNSRNELPAANREALHRAHEAGLKVCLCTGRSLTEARPVIDQIGLDSDVGVFVFGAIVSELPGGRTICRSTIRAGTADRLVGFFLDRDLPVLALFDPQEVGYDYRYILGERATPRAAEALQRWQELAPTEMRHVKGWEAGEQRSIRIGVLVEAENASQMLADLDEAFGREELVYNAIYAPNYGLHVVECFAPHVSKWHGLEQVAGAMEIAGDQIVAIGDDVNDVEMIRHAGLGIAMGNAVPPVKAVADWHAPTHDEAGLAAAIEALLAGNITDQKAPVD